MNEKILNFEDFDNMAKKGITKIVMSKMKYNEFSETMRTKERLKYEILPNVDHINQICTDFGNIIIRIEENDHKLKEGEEVKFASVYREGDLVQYRHGGKKENFSERSIKETQKTHYSKIIKTIPFIDKSSFVLRFNYIMENGRTVPFEDVMCLEKKGEL